LPSPRHKPLFNRRYLITLVWILPLVILLLHLSARPARPLADAGWSPSEQLYFLNTTDTRYRLDLILPDTPALSDADWYEARINDARLDARLASPALRDWLDRQGWQLSRTRAGGYQALQLQMQDRPERAAREAFLSLLTQAPALDEPALHSELSARRYLQRQDAQTLLLATFGAQLPQPTQPPAPLWTLSGPELELTPAPPPTRRLQTLDHWQPGQLEIAPASARTDTAWMLIGEPIPAPASGAALAQQRFVAEAVARLLPAIAPAGAEYRWRWQPLAGGGYRALLLRNWPDSVAAPGQALAAALTDTAFNHIRNSLLERFNQLLDDSPQQWLDLIALYGLALDSDAPFRDTLEQLTPDAARALLEQTLRPEHSLAIRLTTTEP
jgi:hypothetical protein